VEPPGVEPGTPSQVGASKYDLNCRFATRYYSLFLTSLCLLCAQSAPTPGASETLCGPGQRLCDVPNSPGDWTRPPAGATVELEVTHQAQLPARPVLVPAIHVALAQE
jgi:hypothetical protein